MDTAITKIFVFLTCDVYTFEVGKIPTTTDVFGSESQHPTFKKVAEILVYRSLYNIVINFADGSVIEYWNCGYTLGVEPPSDEPVAKKSELLSGQRPRVYTSEKRP